MRVGHLLKSSFFPGRTRKSSGWMFFTVSVSPKVWQLSCHYHALSWLGYHGTMKWLFLSITALSFAAPHPALKDVHNVYLLPMSASFDQYLAVRLTANSVFQVVTDPQKADAIFTERIGSTLEQTLGEMYAPPKKDSKDPIDTYVRATAKPMARGKGSFFLVDRATRNVIWSSFEKPVTPTAQDLDRLAARITSKLEKELKAK
jgi:hypothetical protein